MRSRDSACSIQYLNTTKLSSSQQTTPRRFPREKAHAQKLKALERLDWQHQDTINIEKKSQQKQTNKHLKKKEQQIKLVIISQIFFI